MRKRFVDVRGTFNFNVMEPILGRLRQEIKFKVTLKMVHSTLHPKMHPHIDFGIPTFNSKGGMLHTRCEDSRTLIRQCDYPSGF